MATLSPVELLDWLERNEFLSSPQLQPLRVLLISFPDTMALVKELVRRDWLTPFQVNQIMQGKHDLLLVDAYRLRERIGEGAMGQVFKALQPRVNRIVAIKMLLKEQVNSSKAKERFHREMEAAAKLDHPNIGRVRDAGECDGKSYLVMDFIDGFNLSARVKQQGALPIHEAVDYARQAALGLQHASEKGIVHRDIKPGNLIVTRASDDEPPTVKILDFGLARFVSETDDATRLTEVGKLLGTIDYVAPEQASDARGADIRADIYSLGCSLFYLLTARPPFLGESVVEKLGPRMTGEPPWVRADRPEVSPALEAVLRKIMARQPEDRYQTPLEVARALEPFAAPVAQSVPASAPVTPPVAMAVPVAPSAIAADVPLAQAVGPEPGEQGPAEDSEFLGMTATGRDVSTGAAAATAVTPRGKVGFPVRLIVILASAAAGLALLACLGCIVSSYFKGNDKKNQAGSIVITDAYYSNPNKVSKPGTNRILVFIKRVDFNAPIKVTLKNLPDGVMADPVIVAPNRDKFELPFTVSIGTPAQTRKIRLHLECESLGIQAEQEMQLTIIDEKTKK